MIREPANLPALFVSYDKLRSREMAKVMIGSTKLSELRNKIDFWFFGKKTMSRAEAEAMVIDILVGYGISTVDDVRTCDTCIHDVAGMTCKLDSEDGSAACFRHDHWEPRKK